MPPPDPYVGRGAPTRSYGRPGVENDTVELFLAGAASSNIVVRNIHAQYPTVTIDGVIAKPSMGGYQKIPMVDGTVERLAVYGTVPGFLTVRFRRRTVYREPAPAYLDVVVWLVATVAGGVAAELLTGRGTAGAFAAIGVGAFAAAWLRFSTRKAVPRVALLVLSALAIGIPFITR